jgi:hypothetical protein
MNVFQDVWRFRLDAGSIPCCLRMLLNPLMTKRHESRTDISDYTTSSAHLFAFPNSALPRLASTRAPRPDGPLVRCAAVAGLSPACVPLDWLGPWLGRNQLRRRAGTNQHVPDSDANAEGKCVMKTPVALDGGLLEDPSCVSGSSELIFLLPYPWDVV